MHMIFRGYHAPPRHWGSKYDTLYISNLIRLYLINKKAKHAYESGGQLQLVMTSFFLSVCRGLTDSECQVLSYHTYSTIYDKLHAACCMLPWTWTCTSPIIIMFEAEAEEIRYRLKPKPRPSTVSYSYHLCPLQSACMQGR